MHTEISIRRIFIVLILYLICYILLEIRFLCLYLNEKYNDGKLIGGV